MGQGASAPTHEWEVFIDGTLVGWSRGHGPQPALVSFWNIFEQHAAAKRGPVAVRLVRGEDERSTVELTMAFPPLSSVS